MTSRSATRLCRSSSDLYRGAATGDFSSRVYSDIHRGVSCNSGAGRAWSCASYGGRAAERPGRSFVDGASRSANGSIRASPTELARPSAHSRSGSSFEAERVAAANGAAVANVMRARTASRLPLHSAQWAGHAEARSRPSTFQPGLDGAAVPTSLDTRNSHRATHERTHRGPNLSA